jgi:quercetin dioxygenase-like cupin family protein
MTMTSRKRVAAAGATTTLALAGAAVALATPPSGETPTPLARGALVARADVNAKLTGAALTLKTQGALDALMLEVRLAPGGNGGWHTHAGPAITIVKQGTVTIVDAKCQPHQIAAGHAAISLGSDPSKTENRGTTPVVVDVTFLIPHAVKSPRIDHPAPAGCDA